MGLRWCTGSVRRCSPNPQAERPADVRQAHATTFFHTFNRRLCTPGAGPLPRTSPDRSNARPDAAPSRLLSELTASRRTCILRHPLCRLCARLLSPVRGPRQTRAGDRALPCAFGDRAPGAPEQQAREREEDVSTEQAEAQEGARIPCPDAHACRPGSAQAQARQGSQATLGLTRSGSVSRPTLALRGLLSRLSRGTVCCQQVSGPILFRAL